MNKEETGRKLLKKFWWMMKVEANNGSTALREAMANKVEWLVNLLKNPSSFDKEPFNWKQACVNKENEAIFAFIDTCPNLKQICKDQKDTPLHHIKLDTYQKYWKLLQKPSIDDIKNFPNSKDETPLYRALVEEDIHLARALLSDGKVCRGKRAMEILRKLYEKDDWKEMCHQIHVYPYLTTGYAQLVTSLNDKRTTMSVVGALLATITFAAGFTLPGGLNNDTGYAILAKKQHS